MCVCVCGGGGNGCNNDNKNYVQDNNDENETIAAKMILTDKNDSSSDKILMRTITINV